MKTHLNPSILVDKDVTLTPATAKARRSTTASSPAKTTGRLISNFTCLRLTAATANRHKKTSPTAKDTSDVKSHRVERPELITRSQSAGTTFQKSSPPNNKGKEKAVDFSDLFSFGDGKSSKLSEPMPKTTGMARRMVARTHGIPSSSGSGPFEPENRDSTRRQSLLSMKTDTVIDLTEEAPSTNTSIKMAKSTSFDDSPHANDHATNLRTYGGASRSFLIAIPANQIPSLNDSQLTEDSAASLLQSQEDEFGTHESYTSLRSRWGVDNSEDDPHQPLAEGSTTWLKKKKGKPGRAPPVPLPGPSVSELRSITELRNTGESRRFNDEVGYLFEGLTPESELSVKRGRYVCCSFNQRDTNECTKCRGAGRQDGGPTVLS